jgi:23S rRNA (cytosine1962-C5)-methyltransferase
VELPLGEAPRRVRLSEHSAIFDAPVRDGQKTGWYFDQRNNRERLRNWVKGKRVLDVFSYIGAWGIHAALAGAEQVTTSRDRRSSMRDIARNLTVSMTALRR